MISAQRSDVLEVDVSPGMGFSWAHDDEQNQRKVTIIKQTLKPLLDLLQYLGNG